MGKQKKNVTNQLPVIDLCLYTHKQHLPGPLKNANECMNVVSM